MTGPARVKAESYKLAPGPGQVNPPDAYNLLFQRLGRISGLTTNQRTSLAQSLDPDLVEQVSDAVLAQMVSGTLPTQALHPGAGMPLGLPGSQSDTRYVGGTDSGAPTTGDYHHGDYVIAADGYVWICTVSGTPGTWVQGSGGTGTTSDASTSAKGVVQLAGDLAGTAAAPTVPGLAGKADASATATALAAKADSSTVAGKAAALTVAAVKTGNYTAAANEIVPADTSSGPLTVTLPTAPADGTRVTVKHVAQAGTNTVTVARGGSSDVFNKAGGSTSLTLTYLNQAVTVQYKASGGIWYVVGDDLPTSAVLALGNGTFEPLTVGGKRAVRKDELAVNVADYGDLVNDFHGACVAAAATGRKVLIPAGTYTYTGSALDLAKPMFVGEGADTTTINLASGSYFIDSNQAWSWLHVEGLFFNGGAGAIRNRFTGANGSNARFEVTRCKFFGYTKGAISHNSSDFAFWQIHHNNFNGANSTTSIGIALSGLADSCDLVANVMTRNAVHIKLRHGGHNAHIWNCDLVQIAGGTNRAQIWVVPHTALFNSGQGLTIDHVKFAPESQDATDFRILYADELSGTYNDDMLPDLTQDSTGYITGHRVSDCWVSGNAVGGTAFGRGLVYSTTPKVSGCSYGDIIFSDAVPTSIVEFRTVPLTDWPERQNQYGPFHFENQRLLVPAVSNALGIGGLVDPEGNFEVQPARPHAFPGGGSAVGYTNLLTHNTVAAFTQTGTLSLAGATDSTGLTDAVEATFGTGPNGILSDNVPGGALKAGTPIWIEFDLAPGSTSPLAYVVFTFQLNTAVNTLDDTSTQAFRRLVPVPTVWTRYRFRTVVGAATGTYITKFAANGLAGTVKIGRVRTYHAREPQSNQTIDVQVFNNGAGTWTKPNWATTVHVTMVGAGGGGGAGARSTTGTARAGGGGGGGGALAERVFAASSLPATVGVIGGVGGAGAVGQVTDATAGANGTNGSTMQFGTYLRAGSGTAGTGGGLAAGGTAGSGGTGAGQPGGSGGAGSTSGGSGGGGTGTPAASGGGGGGGLSTGNAESTGAVGGAMQGTPINSGTGGAVTGGVGGAGFSGGLAAEAVPGSGGGGGGSCNSAAGGNGGNGGTYGGGGGGGGASQNGSVSGAGGNGANGICVVISR